MKRIKWSDQKHILVKGLERDLLVGLMTGMEDDLKDAGDGTRRGCGMKDAVLTFGEGGLFELDPT
jgi:hypothetical protein